MSYRQPLGTLAIWIHLPYTRTTMPVYLCDQHINRRQRVHRHGCSSIRQVVVVVVVLTLTRIIKSVVTGQVYPDG